MMGAPCPITHSTRQKALIQLSLSYKTNDHLWFTFFHKAGHRVMRQYPMLHTLVR